MIGGMRAGLRRAGHRAGETRADDAFEDACLTSRDLALGMHGGEPRGDAGAGRRAVDLGLREHADVPGRPIGKRIVAVGQDRAVEEGKVVMIGMRQRELDLQSLASAPLPRRRSRARGRGRRPGRTGYSRRARRRRRHRPCRT